jgi:hypothetical protein
MKFSKIRSVYRMAVVTGALALTAVLGNASAASAASAPELTVTPSTGLADGQSVQAVAGGFTPGEDVYFFVCAYLDAGMACDASTVTSDIADPGGTATVQLTVNRTFEATDPAGNPLGTVDCGTLPAGSCVVPATNAEGTLFTEVPISFA